MPTSGLTFRSGPGAVSLDRSGLVTSVVNDARPRLSYLVGAEIGPLQVDGQVLDRVRPEMLADVDEVEFVYTYADALRLVIRHTFTAGWGVRAAFWSLSAAIQTIENAELSIQPQPGCVGWALAMGDAAAYSIHPDDGAGPLLGGLLRLGSVDQVTRSGLTLGRIDLHPGARYAVQLQWDWYPNPLAFGHDRNPEIPASLFLNQGEAVQLGVDEDVALVAPAGLEITEADGYIDVVSDETGIFPFELRSARGTTVFDLEWVAPFDLLLMDLARQALGRPRTAAGVARLASVADALVLQHALSLGCVDDRDEAAEGLDLFSARIGQAGPVVPLEAAFLCREFDRSGDDDLLAQARSAILAQQGPVPGLGLAATQLCLGLIVSGQPVESVLSHLLQLATELESAAGPRSPDASLSPAASASADAAALELIAVTSAGPGASGAQLASPAAPRIAALGLHLGAGLKGRAVHPLPTTVISHLITVFQLLPDSLSGQLRDTWGCSAHALASRATPELLARLVDEPISEAHAWLVLGLQTS